MSGPIFSSVQLKTISEIFSDIGQVCIASMVIPFIIPGFEKDQIATIILGTSLALLFWTLSILLVKKG